MVAFEYNCPLLVQNEPLMLPWFYVSPGKMARNLEGTHFLTLVVASLCLFES